jgi:hypothetical protein
MVAEAHFLKQVCPIFLEGVPTVNWSDVRYFDGVIREERGKNGGIVIVPYLVVFVANASICSRKCGSGVLVCWARVGKTKLIANPARLSSNRIFIVSSRWRKDCA